MSKILLPSQLQVLVATMVLLVGFSSWAVGDDRFALAIGEHNALVVFGSRGERVAEINVPSISQAVTVGNTSFQVSYGRDANDLLTAILVPNPSAPQDLHFNVLNKSVDADKQAVVTVTFHNANRVTIDPGYVGSVVVNSEPVKHHDLADDSYDAPRPTMSPTPMPRATADVEPRDITPSTSYEPASSSSSASTSFMTTDDSTDASPALSSPPLIGGLQAQPPLPYALNSSSVTPAPSSSSPSSPTKEKLYWSEPVTPPNGTPPRVALNEMKLIEVHGPVSVEMANGETETGEDGMIIPSGSTVITMDNASAAIFMGGVNSARLMPKCELKVTQAFNGMIRKTTIDLVHGAVFSRVGRRPGETQDYEIRTQEGVAAARGTEMLTFYGNMDDLKSPTALNSIREWTGSRLLAWNPTSLGHGQISDVANPMLAAAAAGNNHFYVFVAKGTVECSLNGQIYKVVSGHGTGVGVSVMPPTADANAILQAILEILQPFNFKLQDLLFRIDSHTANAGDIAFYNNLITVFFGNQLPELIQYFDDYPNLYDLIPFARRALNQDLEPFGTNPLTPY